MIHVFLEAIGALTILVIAYSFADPFVRGLRKSWSFHSTAFEGMRKQGRRVKWWRVPLSFIRHAFQFGQGSRIEIRGDGYYWTTEGERLTWGKQTLLPREEPPA